jgi:O-antigen/teichoic acid export membrane protein
MRLGLTLVSGRRRSLLGSLIAGGASQVALIVGGVVVARTLGAGDRGYFALILLVPHILAQVAALGLPLALTYFIARKPYASNQIVRLAAKPAGVQVAAAVVLQGVLLYFLLRDDPSRVRTAGVISLGLIPCLLALQYGTSILQGQQRFRPFNIVRVMPAALYSAGVFAAFVLGHANLVVVTTIQLLAVGLVGAAAIYLAVTRAPTDRSHHHAELHRPPASVGAASPVDSEPAPTSASALIRFGVRGSLGSMSAVETFRVDQTVIGLFLSPVALGLYVVGVSVTNLPRFLAQSVGMVAYPAVASTADLKAAFRLMWRYLWIGVAVVLAVVIPLEALAHVLIPFFFGEDFNRSVPIARVLLAGTVALGARRVLADGARGAGYPGVGTVAEIGAWVVLAPGLALLVPPFGIDGVALALTVSWLLSLAFLVLMMLWLGRGTAVTNANRAATSQVETMKYERGIGFSRQLPERH